ncbi:uncharacterized protein LOC120539333 isoform X1 [Polypterus senegalus]|uniref:uncharacterized protein LOC120539333 isoform X1 n=1 Tax=Polypterus senegalus TaxID=55291 RepID=UPI0019666BC9|nr:uncharacterized protein LOC120539333 isoform X1 [Polypterus senegalus]
MQCLQDQEGLAYEKDHGCCSAIQFDDEILAKKREYWRMKKREQRAKLAAAKRSSCKVGDETRTSKNILSSINAEQYVNSSFCSFVEDDDSVMIITSQVASSSQTSVLDANNCLLNVDGSYSDADVNQEFDNAVKKFGCISYPLNSTVNTVTDVYPSHTQHCLREVSNPEAQISTIDLTASETADPLEDDNLYDGPENTDSNNQNCAFNNLHNFKGSVSALPSNTCPQRPNSVDKNPYQANKNSELLANKPHQDHLSDKDVFKSSSVCTEDLVSESHCPDEQRAAGHLNILPFSLSQPASLSSAVSKESYRCKEGLCLPQQNQRWFQRLKLNKVLPHPSNNKGSSRLSMKGSTKRDLKLQRNISKSKNCRWMPQETGNFHLGGKEPIEINCVKKSQNVTFRDDYPISPQSVESILDECCDTAVSHSDTREQIPNSIYSTTETEDKDIILNENSCSTQSIHLTDIDSDKQNCHKKLPVPLMLTTRIQKQKPSYILEEKSPIAVSRYNSADHFAPQRQVGSSTTAENKKHNAPGRQKRNRFLNSSNLCIQNVLDLEEEKAAKRREYWRIKKREQRAKLTAEDKERIKRRDAQLQKAKRLLSRVDSQTSEKVSQVASPRSHRYNGRRERIFSQSYAVVSHVDTMQSPMEPSHVISPKHSVKKNLSSSSLQTEAHPFSAATDKLKEGEKLAGNFKSDIVMPYTPSGVNSSCSEREASNFTESLQGIVDPVKESLSGERKSKFYKRPDSFRSNLSNVRKSIPSQMQKVSVFNPRFKDGNADRWNTFRSRIHKKLLDTQRLGWQENRRRKMGSVNYRSDQANHFEIGRQSVQAQIDNEKMAKRREYWRLKKREQRAKLTSEAKTKTKDRASQSRRVKKFQPMQGEKCNELNEVVQVHTAETVVIQDDTCEAIGGFIKEDGTMNSVGDISLHSSAYRSAEVNSNTWSSNTLRINNSRKSSNSLQTQKFACLQEMNDLINGDNSSNQISFESVTTKSPAHLLPLHSSKSKYASVDNSVASLNSPNGLGHRENERNSRSRQDLLKERRTNKLVKKYAIKNPPQINVNIFRGNLQRNNSGVNLEDERLARKREYWRLKKREQRAKRAVREKRFMQSRQTLKMTRSSSTISDITVGLLPAAVVIDGTLMSLLDQNKPNAKNKSITEQKIIPSNLIESKESSDVCFVKEFKTPLSHSTDLASSVHVNKATVRSNVVVPSSENSALVLVESENPTDVNVSSDGIPQIRRWRLKAQNINEKGILTRQREGQKGRLLQQQQSQELSQWRITRHNLNKRYFCRQPRMVRAGSTTIQIDETTRLRRREYWRVKKREQRAKKAALEREMRTFENSRKMETSIQDQDVNLYKMGIECTPVEIGKKHGKYRKGLKNTENSAEGLQIPSPVAALNISNFEEAEWEAVSSLSSLNENIKNAHLNDTGELGFPEKLQIEIRKICETANEISSANYATLPQMYPENETEKPKVVHFGIQSSQKNLLPCGMPVENRTLLVENKNAVLGDKSSSQAVQKWCVGVDETEKHTVESKNKDDAPVTFYHQDGKREENIHFYQGSHWQTQKIQQSKQSNIRPNIPSGTSKLSRQLDEATLLRRREYWRIKKQEQRAKVSAKMRELKKQTDGGAEIWSNALSASYVQHIKGEDQWQIHKPKHSSMTHSTHIEDVDQDLKMEARNDIISLRLEGRI